MDAPFKFAIERLHHCPVLRNSPKTVKMTGRDSDTKVGFATLPPSGMSLVAVGFVDHLQAFWRKCRIEFLSYGVAYGHDLGAPFWFWLPPQMRSPIPVPSHFATKIKTGAVRAQGFVCH
jgi:hypothetical protein